MFQRTCNTSVHIQCEVIYDETGVRDINFILSKVQMFEVYTYSYFLAKSMMTVSMAILIHKYAFCSNI